MGRGGGGGIVRARICFKQGQFYLKRLFIWDPLLESDRRGLNGERIVSIHRYRWEIKEYLGGLDWIEEEEISSPFLFLMDILKDG